MPLEKTGSPTRLSDWLVERASELEAQYTLAAIGSPPVTHCPTGLTRLDDAGLLEVGVCTVVLGHEGDGKSALGLRFVKGAASAGYGVQAYWPEDPRRFVADRVLAQGLGESAQAIRRLRISGAGGRIAAAIREAEWAGNVIVDDRRLTSRELIDTVGRRWEANTRLVLVDYAQVMGGETDEKSVERVITRLVWGLNELAKEKNAAIVLLSQVRTEVKERGRRLFDSWQYRNQGKRPTEQAVEGYRPLAGDGQWAPAALGQKSRAVLSWFRPRFWLKQHGVDIEDDIAECMIIKSNYGPAAESMRLSWHGPTTDISDPKG
jgi:replicative DNA helicase